MVTLSIVGVRVSGVGGDLFELLRIPGLDCVSVVQQGQSALHSSLAAMVSGRDHFQCYQATDPSLDCFRADSAFFLAEPVIPGPTVALFLAQAMDCSAETLEFSQFVGRDSISSPSHLAPQIKN